MMLHNLAAEVKTNLAFDDKKFACLRKPFAASFVTTAEKTISTSFSAATEDISFVEIQSFEANFLGKGEVFLEKSEDFSVTANFDNELHSKLLTSKSDQILPSHSTSQFNSSNQSVNSNIPKSALRCLADSKVIVNRHDLASSIYNPEEQLVLPGFAFAQSPESSANFLSSSSPSNFSESSNLPDEPCGNIPALSDECRLKQSPVSVNQVGSCLSEVHTCFHSQSLTSSSDLNSEASSGHLLEMINCLIEEAEVSKLVGIAKEEEISLLRKEVDHLKQASHAILMYLEVLQKNRRKSQQIF